MTTRKTNKETAIQSDFESEQAHLAIGHGCQLTRSRASALVSRFAAAMGGADVRQRNGSSKIWCFALKTGILLLIDLTDLVATAATRSGAFVLKTILFLLIAPTGRTVRSHHLTYLVTHSHSKLSSHSILIYVNPLLLRVPPHLSLSHSTSTVPSQR